MFIRCCGKLDLRSIAIQDIEALRLFECQTSGQYRMIRRRMLIHMIRL